MRANRKRAENSDSSQSRRADAPWLPDEPGGVSLSAIAVAARLPAAACGGQQEVDLAGLVRSSVPSGRKSLSTTTYASLSRPPVRLVTMPGQRAMVDLQVGLNAGRLLQLTVDLRRGQLALLERHVLSSVRLGAFADAERPGRVRLVARAREREVQPAAQVLRVAGRS